MSVVIVSSIPDWMSDKLPVIGDCTTIGYNPDSDEYWVDSCNKSRNYFDTLREAYSDGSFSKNLSFDDSLALKHKVISGCAIFDSETNSTLYARTDNERLKRFEVIWAKLSHKVFAFKRDPTNWRLAFSIIEMHPALWTHLEPLPTFSWITDDGHSHIHIRLNDDTKVDMTLFGDDIDIIEVTEDSFDEAYCKMAEELIKNFDHEVYFA